MKDCPSPEFRERWQAQPDGGVLKRLRLKNPSDRFAATSPGKPGEDDYASASISASAAGSLDAGFCPVMIRPSCTTNGSKAGPFS